MRVCVVGLGAIGGTFAAWLGSRVPASQVKLSALARGATLAAVRAQGLLLAPSEAGPPSPVPLRATDDARLLGVQDLVILAVKGTSLTGVVPALRWLIGPDTRVLCAMNGLPWWFFKDLQGPAAGLQLRSVDPLGDLNGAVPAAQVVGCVVHLASKAPVPGVVHPLKGNGLIIGYPTGRIDQGLSELAELLQRGGFEVTVSECIQRDIWFKLWGNMTMNPISALTGAPCDRILDDPLVRGFASAVMHEAQRIGAAVGLPIAQQAEERHAITRRLGSFKTSMLQDLEAGRPLEIDALVGVVREVGQHMGLITPNIDALLGLVRLMASERGLYTPPATWALGPT